MLLSRNMAVCAAMLDGEICLFDPDNAQYLNLNSTGSAIWELLEEPMELEQIVDNLITKYSIERNKCLEETKLFVEASLKQGFLIDIDA